MEGGQISLFEDKIPVDKNLSFGTMILSGRPEFKVDIEQTFEEKPEDILDVLHFLNKRFYESPLFNQPFTQKEYYQFLGKNIKGCRNENALGEEADKYKRWGNYMERLLYKMLERNIIRRSNYEVPSAKRKIEINEKISLLNNYAKVEQESRRDKRTIEYIADLSDVIKDNMSTFLFYTSLNDYKQLVNNYYRNPNYRFLYFRLENLLNNMRAGINDMVTFGELAHILGYKQTNFNKIKPQIQASVMKLLNLPSLKGLHFRWGKNRNNIQAIPLFELKFDQDQNMLIESRHDKFKRVDMIVLNKLRKILPRASEGKYSYPDIRLTLIESSLQEELMEVFDNAYNAVMRKKPTMESFRLFQEHFVYKDDYSGVYASNLVRHVLVNGQPLGNDSNYNRKHVSFL